MKVFFSCLFIMMSWSLLAAEGVSCLSYEQGTARKCTLLNTDIEAFNFCADYYGIEYFPYQVSKECSLSLADDLYGYVSEKKLNEGLENKIAEVESVMTLLDRHELRSSLTGYISTKPVLKKDFEETILKNLIEKNNLSGYEEFHAVKKLM